MFWIALSATWAVIVAYLLYQYIPWPANVLAAAITLIVYLGRAANDYVIHRHLHKLAGKVWDDYHKDK